QLELARPAGHEEINNVFRTRGEMPGLRLHRIFASVRAAKQLAAGQQRRQRNSAQAHPAAAEEVPPGFQLQQEIFRVHANYSFVKKSSRFISTRATLVQAANTGRSEGRFSASLGGGGFSGRPSGPNFPPL